MQYTHTTTGRVIYDPDRGTMKRNTKWWCILQMDENVSSYLRWHLEKNWWNVEAGQKSEYHRPPHGAHISVIRGERPRNHINQWGRFWSNHRFPVEYDMKIDKVRGSKTEQGWHYTVPIMCPELLDLREYFGLPIHNHRGIFRFHMTVARTYTD